MQGSFLGMGSANDWRRYNVTSSVIGWTLPRIIPAVCHALYKFCYQGQMTALILINFFWSTKWISLFLNQLFDTLRPRPNGQYFVDDIFKGISWNENVWIVVDISLKFIREGPTDNKSSLVRKMTRHRQVSGHYLNQWWSRLPMGICVAQPRYDLMILV